MKLRLPHTFVLLFLLVVVAAIATHFVPAGHYQRVAGLVLLLIAHAIRWGLF